MSASAPSPRRWLHSQGRRELAELRAEGKIRFVGVSNITVGDLKRARSVTDIVSVQNRYSLQDTASEDVLRYAEKHEIAFIPYQPLASGQLTAANGSVAAAAARHDATPAQFALAWALDRSPVMLPIPGTSKLDHLEQNTAAARIRLTSADRVIAA